MGTADNFCLRWNDFHSNVSSSFKELREADQFYDVTLCCDNGDAEVRAHKVVLAACSPFFRKVLLRYTHNNPLIYLKGVDSHNLTAVLNFMYQGEVNVSQDELPAFLKVAEELAIKGLTDSSKADNSHNSSVNNSSKAETPASAPAPKKTPKRPPPLTPAGGAKPSSSSTPQAPPLQAAPNVKKRKTERATYAPTEIDVKAESLQQAASNSGGELGEDEGAFEGEDMADYGFGAEFGGEEAGEYMGEMGPDMEGALGDKGNLILRFSFVVYSKSPNGVCVPPGEDLCGLQNACVLECPLVAVAATRTRD